MNDTDSRRSEMVERWIRGRGVRDTQVLAVMEDLPREPFLPEHLHDEAYEDRPLTVAEGQTAPAPHVVAYMIEALGLRGGEKVLEIGAGTGYAAAILSRIAGEVFAIERHGELDGEDRVGAAGHRLHEIGRAH